MGEEKMKSVEPKISILDLPDEILQICFARLPLHCLPIVRVVCQRWHRLSDAQFLRRIRKALHLTQTCTFFLENEYISGSYQGLQGQAFDSHSNMVRSIATLRGPQRLQFGAVGADGLLYILGGRSPLRCQRSPDPKAWSVYSRVDMYEPLSNCWQQMEPMLEARFGFASGVLLDTVTSHSKLIVAGGYDAEGATLSSAEVYDFLESRWETIPNMLHMCGPCKGEVFDGKFYVQQANCGPDSIEIFDPSSGRWTAYNPKTCRFSLQASDTCGTAKSITLDL